ELEGQKKTLINRVKDLENKLSIAKNENQKEKITENVEYIRVWRQMKLQQEKLTEFESKNKSLLEEIADLKSCLCEAKKSCSPTAKLVEKKLMGELEEQIARSQSYQAALREKDEQVRDLTSEIKILQQHNSELIGISTKYSQVEIENMELKKQLGDMMTDNHNLKCACNQEQANVKALQAANAQLIDKLQELQRNNDLMSIQLKSPKSQKEKADKTNYESQSPKKSNYCQECNSKKIRSKNVDDDVNKSRNEYELPIKNTYVECGSQTDVFPERDYVRFENNDSNKNLEDFGGNKSDKPGNLSPEAMLKLLDDAQINTPLDAQNVAKIRLLEGLSPNHCGDTSNRQRQVIALETLLFGDNDY
ncbi:GSCOCG00003791001-RA-CDS, partial [Cotesia congregata]